MDFLQVMVGIILAGLGITVSFFRKGGLYNPTEAPVEPLIAPASSVPPPVVSDSTPSPTEPNKATLDNLCLAIRDFEGLQVNAKGKPDKNWKNNNPGNCRYSSVGYLPKYLPVLKDKDGFAVFKDYATGWMYLQNMLKAQIHLHPNWTILDMMTNYAPESDNNPTLNYAKHVARRLGVDIRFKVKNIAV